MKIMTFDVGGTQIKYGLLEDGPRISGQGRFATPRDSFEQFLSSIETVWNSYKDQAEGIAMTLPGPVDPQNGYCTNCSIMAYPHDKAIAKAISERCGCKVVLQNDGKAAALAEHRYGAIKGANNAAVFLIGTGVGGGLIINGDLVLGPQFSAGEFSFLITEAPCYADADRMLGGQASTTYLLRRYAQLSNDPEHIDGLEFFRRLETDDAARQALDDLCTNIAVAAFNLYFLLDLEKLAIGGGISSQPVVITRIKEKFAKVWQESFAGKINFPLGMEIVPCQYRNDTNLIGAYITYIEH